MTQEQFENKLKLIEPKLSLRVSPQAPDMCGIYYEEIFITGVPSGNIYEEVKPEYQNPFGVPHKTSVVALAQVQKWLDNKEENIALEKELSEL